jgi:hypothetical protein
MPEDSYTEVTHESWFSRLGSAFKGIVIGMVLIAAAFVLLFWNEGRAVKRQKTLEEGGGAVIGISAARVDPQNEGRLVHLSGAAAADGVLTDPIFGLTRGAIKLQRIVEMYQWRESSQTKERKKVGGGTEKVTTYTYEKVWSESLIRSDGFKKPQGHANPTQMPYRSAEISAPVVTVGAFTLSSSLVAKINRFSPVVLRQEDLSGARIAEPPRISASGGHFLTGRNESAPAIGDVRISFREVKPMEISLVAQQSGETFQPYTTGAGGQIELLEYGQLTKEEMFKQAQKSNTMMTWILRVAGFVLMFFGFQLVLAPLAVFADVLPALGSIVVVGTTLMAGLVAGILSFLTIGIAWMVYRPLIGAILFAIAAALAALIVVKARKKTPERASTAPPPPPSPA